MWSSLREDRLEQRPRVERPRVERPRVERPRVGRPRVGRPRVGRPRVGRPRVGRPRVGRPRVGRPRVGRPRVEREHTFRILSIGDSPMVADGTRPDSMLLFIRGCDDGNHPPARISRRANGPLYGRSPGVAYRPMGNSGLDSLINRSLWCYSKPHLSEIMQWLRKSLITLPSKLSK